MQKLIELTHLTKITILTALMLVLTLITAPVKAYAGYIPNQTDPFIQGMLEYLPEESALAEHKVDMAAKIIQLETMIPAGVAKLEFVYTRNSLPAIIFMQKETVRTYSTVATPNEQGFTCISDIPLTDSLRYMVIYITSEEEKMWNLAVTPNDTQTMILTLNDNPVVGEQCKTMKTNVSSLIFWGDKTDYITTSTISELLAPDKEPYRIVPEKDYSQLQNSLLLLVLLAAVIFIPIMGLIIYSSQKAARVKRLDERMKAIRTLNAETWETVNAEMVEDEKKRSTEFVQHEPVEYQQYTEIKKADIPQYREDYVKPVESNASSSGSSFLDALMQDEVTKELKPPMQTAPAPVAVDDDDEEDFQSPMAPVRSFTQSNSYVPKFLQTLELAEEKDTTETEESPSEPVVPIPDDTPQRPDSTSKPAVPAWKTTNNTENTEEAYF